MYCLLSRPYAFGCVLKMRTSQGFDPGHSYGHFFLDPQYENVQHINCCESIQIIIDVTQKYMSSWGSTSTRLLHEFMSSAVARSSTRLMKSGGARAGAKGVRSNSVGGQTGSSLGHATNNAR
ncbi:hypothetical protein CFC21_105930 [Triticum aestivum]|uniref:Uncharacterized protein n=2 Tax=Triticum aestivum TaxID=4565 RepID=A0A1D6SDU4_WHEAT|nr:hypothetical protein CFC21_006299 [Triticum aestivum]KAF7066915.1 hypothetical protein CFC21_072837 [Triticum aestivum]KAF7105092.1 hypothetical protein CFC21_105930 [Triticum aestivum]